MLVDVCVLDENTWKNGDVCDTTYRSYMSFSIFHQNKLNLQRDASSLTINIKFNKK